MAVTITRTPWIDDDGTGTTGTVINNAVKTSIYDEIDGALSKVAQVSGGNSFVGVQTVMNGAVLIARPASAYGELLSVATSFGFPAVALQNTAPTPDGQYVWFLNSADGSTGSIAQTGTTTVAYGTTSDARLKDDRGRATDLEALRGVLVHDFTWKADGVPDRGVFAQEAHRVFPRAVVTGTDETTETGALARPWMTDYSKFVPDLIVGWQHHDAALDEIRAQLATLKGSPDAQ
jgi:hypothetical protein